MNISSDYSILYNEKSFLSRVVLKNNFKVTLVSVSLPSGSRAYACACVSAIKGLKVTKLLNKMFNNYTNFTNVHKFP